MKPAVTHEFVEIGPEEAERLLALNDDNRKKRPGKMHDYATAMRTGHWTFDGAPIRISKQNVLLDGQHRLEAVRASGTRQWFSVIRGLDKSAQINMDNGISRTLQDYLKIYRGEDNPTTAAQITRSLYLMDKGASPTRVTGAAGGNSITLTGDGSTEYQTRNSNPTTAQLLEYFDSHAAEIREATAVAHRIHKATKLSTRLAGLAFASLARVDVNDAVIFFERLETGVNLDANDPILVLRNRLLEDAATKTKVAANIALARVYKAWNFWREGVEVQRIFYRPSVEKFPEPR